MGRYVTAVRSVHFGTPDMAASAEFYERIWGLTPVAEEGGRRYFRATGMDHHVLVLEPRAQAGLVRTGLAAADAAAVDAVYERLVAAGHAVTKPGAVRGPGGGYGFVLRDPEGREFELRSDVRDHADHLSGNDRPFKISHVVLNAVDADAATAFFTTLLDFRLRDRTGMMHFLGCNADHHSIAVTRIGNTSLNHVAFELPDFDGVMHGSGRLKQNGYPIQWGVGRHGPGANIFSYFIDPNDLAIEYTTEMQNVDDATYVVGTPETWARGTNLDAWGLADPPTRRFDVATHFADAAKASV